MNQVYAEVGYGNESFLSTEIEEGESEYRIPKFVLPQKITEIYFRIWIGKTVYILSSKKGFNTKEKDRKKFKIIFGIGGQGFKGE